MIKIPNTSPASIFTQQKASTLRMKDEIKYTFNKKIESTTLTLTLDFSQLIE
jgi:hypothetical protein